jgi:hypothetical protein
MASLCDLAKVDCAAGHHVALLTPEVLLGAGLIPAVKVLDLKRPAPVPRLRKEGRAVISIKWQGHLVDSDDFGQSFRAEVGHRFRLMSAGHSD